MKRTKKNTDIQVDFGEDEPLPDIQLIKGLDQTFIDKSGVTVSLREFLTVDDWYEMKKKRVKVAILYHDGVKKIATAAGLKPLKYTEVTSPSVYNNYQYTLQCTLIDSTFDWKTMTGELFIGLGESNRHNLGSKGRNNPANMAEKRAFDRAVFAALGINGLLAEDELADEEEQNVMENLPPDSAKIIVPLLNEILQAKERADLIAFRAKMKKLSTAYTEPQLNALRTAWSNKLAKLEKTF